MRPDLGSKTTSLPAGCKWRTLVTVLNLMFHLTFEYAAAINLSLCPEKTRKHDTQQSDDGRTGLRHERLIPVGYVKYVKEHMSTGVYVKLLKACLVLIFSLKYIKRTITIEVTQSHEID